MSREITINPLTRISGFIEIKVQIENHKVIEAQSSGLLFRGFEKMLRGRSPFDAIYFTERICGICSTAHAMASTLALENALIIRPSDNDKMIREFMHGCEFIQNHLRHFYLYTIPDFVRTPEIEPLYDSKNIDFRLPEPLNKRLAKHYLEAIKYSKMAHEALAILGGKAPHNHGIFVGGITVNFDSDKYIRLKAIIGSIKDFIVKEMIEDVYIIAQYYGDYFDMGRGHGNLMSYGLYNNYPDRNLSYVKEGVLIKGNREPFNPYKITENIHSSWYEVDKKENDLIENVDKKGAYSFVKAPRYEGLPMEVGPLARMILSGNYRTTISAMDRTIARVLECGKVIKIMENLLDKIENKPAFQNRYGIPDKAEGYGLTDTTRGALGHWLMIEDKVIKNYNIVTPSVWNCSPKDGRGIRGVVEEALIGTEIMDISNPIEIGRIVRSFDPCISCATH